MSEVKLLPCPFCGEEPNIEYNDVQCWACGAEMPGVDSAEEAIDCWNTRAQAPLQRWAPGSDAPQGLYRYWDNVNEVWSALFLRVFDTGERMLVLMGVDGLFDWTDETLYGPIPAPDVDAARTEGAHDA